MDSGEHRDHEFADVALEKVLEARRWPWAKLPEKLGEALRAELAKSTGVGVPEAVRQGGPLGYVALYQRIRNRTLPPTGQAAEQYEPLLRLAFTNALRRRRPIAKLVFRTDRPVERTIVRAPADTILELFADRARSGMLGSTTYHLVARDFRLGTAIQPLHDYTSGDAAAYSADEVLQYERSSHAVAYAQFARYIAAGFQQGFSLRVYLSPSLEFLGIPGDRPPDAETMRHVAARHIAALIDANEREALLALEEDDRADARSVVHLARVSPTRAAEPLPGSVEAAIQRRLHIYELGVGGTAFIDRILRVVPARLLLEESRQLPRPNAYLWTRLQPDDSRPPVERLLKLDSSTATELQKQLHVLRDDLSTRDYSKEE